VQLTFYETLASPSRFVPRRWLYPPTYDRIREDEDGRDIDIDKPQEILFVQMLPL
jgi:hypothetical protein